MMAAQCKLFITPVKYTHTAVPFAGKMSTHTLTLYSTLGAFEIGVWLSMFLCGSLTFQIYFYFTSRRSSSDSLGLQPVAHTVGAAKTMWCMTTTNFGHPNELFETRTMFAFYISGLISNLVCPFIQVYYVWRIWRFSRAIYIPSLCLLLLLGRTATGITMMSIGFGTNNALDFAEAMPGMFAATMALPAMTDILITASTCFYLRRGRQNTVQTCTTITTCT
ncbi:hypothetical protein PLICRDRAFT_91330 [Plicaturopsis crispa FD-325 SS-3]|nr:hypothetical protein PLICRDRAFT_91330 [Plicaturopsis crispa FD-325 SS-3]